MKNKKDKTRTGHFCIFVFLSSTDRSTHRLFRQVERNIHAPTYCNKLGKAMLSGAQKVMTRSATTITQ